jgi:long-chain acyl-CoA synthetase
MDACSDRPWYKVWPEGVPRHIDYPEIPLFELLTGRAGEQPERIAFSVGGQDLSYRELDTLSSRLANGLRELGVESGDRVMLFLFNSLEFVIGYYGILKAGAAITPANPLYRSEDLKHQLHDSGSVAIITNEDAYPAVRDIKDEVGLRAVVLAGSRRIKETVSLQEILSRCPSSLPRSDIKPREDVAVIAYTGGTTGLPKGVLLTHYNLVANAVQNALWLGWSREDVIIGLLPFYHSWGGCTCVNSPVYSGARVVILPRYGAEELLLTIEKEKGTVLYGAASLFAMLVSDPALGKYDISSLKYVKAGAMPIPPEIKEKWEQLTGVSMLTGYGLSEASPETHDSPLGGVKPGSIGIPISDTDARIVDEQSGTTELPPGEVGELVVRGPQVMKGYLNQPEDTAEVLRNGWLYTGDLALMDEAGYFQIVDRKKETIKYKGYTIAPAEIESVLYQHPSLKECAVIGRPDSLAGEVPKAYVVLKDGCTSSGEELIDFCRQRVAPYKRVREVVFIEEVPKTPVGKILRRVLRDKEKCDGGDSQPAR